MKKKAFLLNALLLTGASLLMRTIGISFRVYLSNKIGAEGIGLYSLVLTIYMFVTTFATSGVSLSVTRLVTDAIAEGRPGKARRVTKKCFVFSLIMSLLAGGALFLLAGDIGTLWLKDPRAVLPLRILAPSLPFMAVSACFRGYFFAVRKVVKTVSEQLFEQFVEILVFSSLVGLLAPKGIEYACCAIVIGTTVAEVVSCLYSFLLYIFDVKHLGRQGGEGAQKGLFRKIMGICLPVTASSCLRSGLSMVENILIPKGLKKNGASSSDSLAHYGMLTGMVMPVLTFPSAFLSSFSMLLIPELSEANAVHHKKNINYIATRVFQITLLFSILVTGVFLFFAKDLGALIYGNVTTGTYIRVLAPIIPLMYLDSVVDGMLKGLGEQVSYLSYNIIDSIIRVILIYSLVPVMGLNGVIVVIFVSEILNSTLSILRLIKVTKLHFKVLDWLVKPFMAVAVAGLLVTLAARYTALYFSSALSFLVCEIVLFLLIYYVILRLTGCISREDLSWVKHTFQKNRA